MSKKYCVEIAEFKLAKDMARDEFVSMVDELEVNFHSKQEGFISTDLLDGADGRTYIMVQHWETIEHAHNASKAMMQSDLTLAFRSLMSPKDVSLRYLERIQKWD